MEIIHPLLDMEWWQMILVGLGMPGLFMMFYLAGTGLDDQLEQQRNDKKELEELRERAKRGEI